MSFAAAKVVVQAILLRSYEEITGSYYKELLRMITEDEVTTTQTNP